MVKKRKKIDLKKKLREIWESLKKEISEHKFIYILLFISLAGGLAIRTYRTDQILGFYYDQGRDALRVWDFWHERDIMLIGPTTGIAGIFRGPFYFYLIAPFYLIGGGNPVVPAYFLAILSMAAVVVLYYLGARIQDRTTGLIAAIIASFSFYIMVASRWLSNPTPMLLLSVLLLWMMLLVDEGKKWAWIVIALILGLSQFHFGGSGEFFYFLGIGVFGIWQVAKKRKGLKGVSEVIGIKEFLLSVLAFLFAVSPLIVFDLTKDHLLSQNIREFFVEKESFKTSLWEVAQIRFKYYYDVFSTKIFHYMTRREEILLWSVFVGFILFLPRIIKNDGVKTTLIMMLAPIIGFLFFQGNQGNIYDYYMTGYYLIFILLFAITLGQFWKYKLGKVFVVFFIYVFLSWSWMVTKGHISAGVDGETTVAFGNQKQAVEWVFEDAKTRCDTSEECLPDFNVDVYVPPVIPHTYDYLFRWYGNTKYEREPVEERVELLYTLYEVDPPHPERLQAWLDRQAGIGEMKDFEKFGGVTVERRKRILYEE